MKLQFSPYIYILIALLFYMPVFGQNFQLKPIFKQNGKHVILEKLNFKTTFVHKKNVFNEIDSISKRLELIGYLNQQLDTIVYLDSIYTPTYNLGNQIKMVQINYTSLPIKILSKKTLHQISSKVTNTFFEIPFSEVKHSLQFLTNQFENSGNTFTKLQLSNISFKDQKAFAVLKIKSSKTRTIDKIVIKGYEEFPKSFIQHELHLKIGSKFNREKLTRISTAINKIRFTEELKSPEVLFTNDSTFIYLYLKKKKSNKFDGIIGFSSKEDKNGIEFNGYLNLSFNNIFNTGESIDLFWKNNGNDSQRFFVATEIPYIFNLPIIPKINFELFRQDSTYNNIATNINLSYALNSIGYISGSFESENSNNLLKTNNTNIKSYKNYFYGIKYGYNKLWNDQLFPIKYKLEIGANFGLRKTEKNSENQSKFNFIGNYLWALNSKNFIFIQNQSALLNSKEYIENELYRIGGVYNIRGVNEESILASGYSIFNIEYRYKASATSYFYSITDFAAIENKLNLQNLNIYSLGIGYALITKIGQINLSYALSKNNTNPINLNDSKFHINIISIF